MVVFVGTKDGGNYVVPKELYESTHNLQQKLEVENQMLKRAMQGIIV